MTDEARKELLELLIKGDHNYEEILKANIPQYLYKYRSGNEWDLDALEKDSIWMGNATKMDDPADCKVLLSKKLKEQIELTVNFVEDFNDPKYKELLDDNVFQKDCFLCSLSEISDSDDMWGRYANNEQGFCIEYNAVQLFFKAAGTGLFLLPVCYDKKNPSDAKSLSDSDKRTMIFKNFLVKDKVGKNGEDWLSQREWRIIGFRKNLGLSETEENGKCIQIIKPSRIILGMCASDRVKMRIMNWKKQDGNESIIVEQR